MPSGGHLIWKNWVTTEIPPVKNWIWYRLPCLHNVLNLEIPFNIFFRIRFHERWFPIPFLRLEANSFCILVKNQCYYNLGNIAIWGNTKRAPASNFCPWDDFFFKGKWPQSCPFNSFFLFSKKMHLPGSISVFFYFSFFFQRKIGYRKHQ